MIIFHTSKLVLNISAKFMFCDETNFLLNQDFSFHFLMLGCLDWTKKKKGAVNLFSFQVFSVPFEISYSLLFVVL